jgi:hypothetical protein
VFELEQKYQIGFLASLLPAHVSLKQPFSFENMERLESYLDGLAAHITPFPIELDEIYYTEWGGYGILGMNVQETDTLRRLSDHTFLAAEIALFYYTGENHQSFIHYKVLPLTG